MVYHGVFLQTIRRITGIFEYAVLASQGIFFPNTSLTKPTFSSNSILKINPIATAAQIFGRKVAVLKNAFPFSSWLFSREAIRIARNKISTSPVSQYTTVFHRASQNMPSISIFLKLSSPTNSGAPIPLHFVRLM